MNVIVVGIDHSDGAKEALRFAIEEAMLRGARVRALHAWQFGFVGAPGIEGAYPVVGADLSDLHKAAGAALESAISDVAGEQSEVEIERRLVEGTPAAALVDESRDADMLVVGSRGHGGFAGLLLGSVSQQVAHHAMCPVVIVHPKAKRES